MEISEDTENELERLRREVEKNARIISLGGLTSIAAKAFVLSTLQRETGKPLVIVADSNKDLEIWENDLAFFSHRNPKSKTQNPKSQIATLPATETDIYAGVSPHAETLEKRALTLWHLSFEQPDFLIASARSLIGRTLSPDEIRRMGAVLRLDEDFPPEELTEKLAGGGYVREDPIKNVGEFSQRGGIVDVWPPNAENPVRVEFFGDTVDSIREFDAETQLSTRHVKEIRIAPMRPLSAGAQDFRDWADSARQRFGDEKFARNLKDRTDFADEGEDFSGWEFLMPLVKPFASSVFDYLKAPVLVIDEPGLVEQNLENFHRQTEDSFARIEEHGEIGLAPSELFLSGEELREKLKGKQRIELRALGRAAAETDEEFGIDGLGIADSGSEPRTVASGSDRATGGFNKKSDRTPLFLFPMAEKALELEITSRSTRKFHGNIRDLAEDIKNNQRIKTDSGRFFVFQTPGMAERFSDILRDYDVVLPPDSPVIGDLSAGFEIPSLKLTVHTESDVFGETQGNEFPVQNPKSKIQNRKSKTSAFVSDFRDLKPGDFVVHVDHGIGRFEGLQTLETGGMEREFMLLIYADGAKLFVPVERLDLVSRYSSGETSQPSLDRLGGIGWQKTKAKAKRAMRDMADELLRLYAERKLVQGFAFSGDTPWQKEFEDAFPYQLTPDQAVAIDDAKKDMQRPVPMDRLVVGDVGYGKTEVAMRAAFKAVMDGKQVAVLTPTTILAYQHSETFKGRFSAFPVNIELLSRFRSRKEQKEVVEKTGKGEVDILIGTHRILSNDVALPKIGLVVVDEEQRFGVAHKEKLKKLKKKVDVLTLSATPIPRTLNMSLLGMRDLSVIETPPRDRLAINTQVVQFSEGVIKTAIELELARNGQVFFIHNRVETIEAIAAHVKKIVPNARVAVGHGQMNERELEDIMLDFVAYKYDVLVATTIIENGIDIPRANTIIINRADNYGLSQLYQLRGRVGRSNRRAYAYLLIPGELQLTPIARRRLSAIREFSDLGAGFRIAALDLELRGAGNILGGQQSGHLDALGFDLYVKMLERTIAELKGEEIEDESSVSLNLGVDVSIPVDYISETSQRLRTYKRISSADRDEDLRLIYTEIQDRYGKLPPSVENLFEHARLRKLAEYLRIVSVDKTREGIAVKLSENARIAPERLMDFLDQNEGSKFSPSGILQVTTDSENPIEKARQVLEQIRAND
ncbi:MAG: transcription-repair coupling factor [Pyrinomonadaceae bacterium]